MSGRLVMRKSHRKRHLGMGRRRRRMHGRGLGSFLGKANNFLRDNKIISRVANTLAESGIAPGLSGTVGKIASTLGYGRRRRRHRRAKVHAELGGALKLAGMGLSRAGGRRHHRRRYY